MKKHRTSILTKKPGIPWWVWAAAGGGLILVLTIVLILVLSGGGRDPTFDQVKKGMTEEAVLELLGTPWSHTPRAVGTWTYPRMTQDDVLKNQERNKEIKDVIFVYFRDGKVDNIYRTSGADFRKPRPR